MKANIIYYSATGNTEMMAQHIYEVLSDQNFDVTLEDLNLVAVLIFSATLFILRKYKLNPILAIIATGIVGLLIY